MGTLTVPQVILFLLYRGTYQIIESLLTEENLGYWWGYGSIFITLWGLVTLYAVFSVARGHKIHPIYAGAVLLIYIPLLYFFMRDSSHILPWSVPRWMLFEGDVINYVYTFTMPALLHALMVLVLYFTPRDQDHKAWVNFWASLAVPAFWYLALLVLVPILNNAVGAQFLEHVFSLLQICSVVIFLFLLIRFFYILVSRYESGFKYLKLAALVLVCVIFPVFGLWLNDELGRLFGNFSEIIFYVVAGVNGVLLCLPSPDNSRLRLMLFGARVATYPYIIYFFLVFLPFLPLSVLAIIVYGGGFLMLTPLAVMIIQSWKLADDYQYLKAKQGVILPTTVFLVALVLLPALVFDSYRRDKLHLDAALDYVYERNYELNHEQSIQAERVQRTLENIKIAKQPDAGWFGTKHKPFLSSFYQWYVLENLTLSDTKIQTLEKIFQGYTDHKTTLRRRRVPPPSNDSIQIDSVYVVSFEADDQAYTRSWIHLEIQNQSQQQVEFRTAFELPNGCYISDYYLDIEGRREKGLLTEKRAARWIYNQITSFRRDPGILFYENGRQVRFQIFPFQPQERRFTGMEILHRTPLSLEIAGQKIQLGDSSLIPSKKEIFKASQAHFIPASAMAKLPQVKRQPYYHFVLDGSRLAKKEVHEQIKSIESLLAKKLISSDHHRISWLNHQMQTWEMKENWQEKITAQPKTGGFFLEYGLKSILLNHDQKQVNTYPIIVVLTDSLSQAVFTGELAAFAQMSPEGAYFYVLNGQSQLNQYSFLENPLQVRQENMAEISSPSVYAYPDAKNPQAYFSLQNGQSVVYVPDLQEDFSEVKLKDKTWQNALLLDAMHQQLTFYPEKNAFSWLPLVQNSFRTQVMSPETAYIVVETEAQKQALLAKQKQILAAKKTLDAGEETIRMSEPAFWWGVLGLLIWLAYRRFKGVLLKQT